MTLSPDFSIAYPPDNAPDAVALGQTVAARYQRIAATMGFSSTLPTGLLLYPDEAALRADTDLSLPPDTAAWVGPGLIDGQPRPVVKLVAANNLTATQSLTDSLVQLALAQAGRNPNNLTQPAQAKAVSWFWQGVPLVWQSTADPVAAQQRYLPALTLALVDEAEPDPAMTAALAWAAVDQLYQQAGWPGIGQLAAALNEGQPLDAALRSISGQSAADFEANWRTTWQTRLVEAQTGLAQVLAARQAAVMAGDITALLATNAAPDSTFTQEEQNWLRLPENQSQPTFSLTGRPLAFLDDGSLLAEVDVHYGQVFSNNEVSRDWRLRIRFTRTDTGYRWAGPLFEARRNGRLTI
jgi:hypothetical protein